MSIKNRVQKLERKTGGGHIIYFTDTINGEEPVIRTALIDGAEIERKPDEPQGDFMRRANPAGRPHVLLEHDSVLL